MALGIFPVSDLHFSVEPNAHTPLNRHVMMNFYYQPTTGREKTKKQQQPTHARRHVPAFAAPAVVNSPVAAYAAAVVASWTFRHISPGAVTRNLWSPCAPSAGIVFAGPGGWCELQKIQTPLADRSSGQVFPLCRQLQAYLQVELCSYGP